MSNLPISSKYRSTPHEPVDDNERNQLTARLADAFAEGKLDDVDYRNRLDRLYAANTLGELVPVVEGLPPVQTYQDPAIVEQGSTAPGELAPSRDASRFALAVGGGIAVSIVLLVILLVILL
ncbi:DUF1707 SHOCT-like domain-containing protein [Enemella sp. A6]|uniref:DUF1707 SHOCT-like domain-containing protein n=1 Tax=Enemella sp. A6 TaxID=3440152 RepID=UPI003EB8416E